MKNEDSNNFLLKNKSFWEKKTPCFFIDKKVLNKSIDELKEKLEGEIAYSHKTNPDPIIVKAVYDKGCSFLVSSVEELRILLKRFNPSPERIIFQSPSLTLEQYDEIKGAGVYRFSIDSKEQLALILQDIKNNKNTRDVPELFVRINTGIKIESPELPYGMDSYLGFPLSEAEEVLKGLNELKKDGLIKIGVHNHLLSQNTYLDIWKKNLEAIADFVLKLKNNGIEIDSIDFGGGYPVEYEKSVPALSEISDIVNNVKKIIAEILPNMHYVFEPGRKLVAESTALITKVVHTKKFLEQDVAILNCSLYNCSLDTLIIDLYLPAKKIERDQSKETKKYIVRGSTPDSLDVFAKKIYFSELKSGDYIAFLKCGAYSFGCDFISLPKVGCIECQEL